jgi:hypothetical protein
MRRVPSIGHAPMSACGSHCLVSRRYTAVPVSLVGSFILGPSVARAAWPSIARSPIGPKCGLQSVGRPPKRASVSLYLISDRLAGLMDLPGRQTIWVNAVSGIAVAVPNSG